jgi:hypothetical protein
MLAFDQTTRTLFSSDVFITPPGGPAVLDGWPDPLRLVHRIWPPLLRLVM